MKNYIYLNLLECHQIDMHDKSKVKIYSRPRIHLPKIKLNKKGNGSIKQKIKKNSKDIYYISYSYFNSKINFRFSKAYI